MSGNPHNADELSANFDDAKVRMWFSSLRTFAGLTGALLLVGFLANAYLLWVTNRLHCPVHWETFRLILRYSSVVDLSLCVVLSSVIPMPLVFAHTGSDMMVSLRCARFGIGDMWHCGLVVTGTGVLVFCRQMFMLHMFEHETTLKEQHSGRMLKLVRDVVVVGVVCAVAAICTTNFAPDYELELCFVVSTVTTRTVYLLLVPFSVSIVLGVIAVTRASGQVSDSELHRLMQPTNGTLFEKATPSLESFYSKNRPAETNHSRYDRFVIVTSVSALKWFLIAVAMAMAGVLVQPTNIDIFLTLAGCTALDSVWSAYSVYRYWT